ncbi:amidohydrolase family protein [Micromonospora sp. NPDC048830]|uniref:amidohydrolase family protein n=1 Tax=Micromonospora sp. NPDC048830 TaxID=3364257 RepID=UPI003711872E
MKVDQALWPWRRSHLIHQIEALPLVDHHVHSVFDRDLTRAELEASITEAPRGPAAPHSQFDSQLGFALRRYCAPVLGLPPFADPDKYLAHRKRLGFRSVTRRLTRAAGISAYCLDGGYRSDQLMAENTFGELSGATVHRIVRLETVAEQAVTGSVSGEDFLRRLANMLDDYGSRAVGYKTVAAYRCGLALDPARPTDTEILAAAARWHGQVTGGDAPRLKDAVLTRHLIWWALEQGKPLQVHTGFGDPDLTLRMADPALLQPLIARSERTAGKLVLLHCYPFERSAGYLAHAYPHVYLDTGLAVNYLGANAESLLRSAMDLTPFHKLLFSTDAWGLPELVYLGARLWRTATARVLAEYVRREDWPIAEAVRVARMAGSENARAVYSLGRGY